MLLTISTNYRPATELGFLLAKHPDKCQSFELSFGVARVFYPESSHEKCSACLLVDVNPIALARGMREGAKGTLGQYVNDRPYVASSFLSVAIAQVFGSALNGRSRERPELAATAIELEAELPVVRCHGGEPLLRALFEPLNYSVEVQHLPLDPKFPELGPSPYFSVKLQGHLRLQELLSHLYVLLPVLDNSKHYYVAEDEIAKLVSKGEGWLGQHPHREQIAKRYFKDRNGLATEALAQLMADEQRDNDAVDQAKEREEAALEKWLSLNDQRTAAVLEVLRSGEIRSVVDLGCGEGKLLRALLNERSIRRIVGVDVSCRALEIAHQRLGLDNMPPRKRERIELIQGALTYRDARFADFDAACLVEVIEHLDEPRLGALERTVFEFARPKMVIVTTPNVESNVLFANLEAGLRHRDHRFEWTRAEFEAWAREVAERRGYAVRFVPVGHVHDQLGPPTQMGVFTR